LSPWHAQISTTSPALVGETRRFSGFFCILLVMHQSTVSRSDRELAEQIHLELARKPHKVCRWGVSSSLRGTLRSPTSAAAGTAPRPVVVAIRRLEGAPLPSWHGSGGLNH
jgi:hypothetical protein